ncbi:MAG: RdgB/HAM1 family non-canonical purine NTP pyrophosphatase [Acidimicrobiia bacterium]|nr:RdgB/HAM1 family non-canonical purine NTP pyrophosphatase [Acidimicrobiia bacterium]
MNNSVQKQLQLVAATANPHKLQEISVILGSAVKLLARPNDLGEIIEDGPTLEANARLKATAVCEHTGWPAVADDTGLEVAALGGAPGVHSARYGGSQGDDAANCRLLLANLQGVTDRSARFRTIAVVAFSDGVVVQAEGVVCGSITELPKGDKGFGYDSLFAPDGADGRTFAEMSAQEKNLLSHRGKAFRTLAYELSLY